MKLDDFLEQLREDVGGFARMWMEGRHKDPDLYPMELEPGDWFDQYIIFITGEAP
jgi:hypothetical protein